MTYYKKTIGAILAKDNGKFYILRNRELFNINEVGARIFNLCNGKNSFDDIVQNLKSIFDIDELTLKNDVTEYLDALCNMELIKKKLL